LIIESPRDVDEQLERVKSAALATAETLKDLITAPPLCLFLKAKFERFGRHPTMGHRLNLVEQINQTWTFIAALEAARLLLGLKEHASVRALHLAPGAHVTQKFDIMSTPDAGETLPHLAAEAFAAVTPTNNGKLKKDLSKLALPVARYRYVFMICPLHPRTEHLVQYDQQGVAVWSLANPIAC
jgi:hypothetical protein